MIDAALLIAGVMLNFVQMGNPVGTFNFLASMLLFAYAGVSFFWTGSAARAHNLKVVLLALIIATTVGYRTVDFIALRHEQPNIPLFDVVHDHALQTEAVVAFLLQGKNPYGSDYSTTELVEWLPRNPAVYHVIALPFSFLKSVPFKLAADASFGWYDDRMSQIALFVLAAVSLYCLFKDPERKLIAVIVFAFNPLFAEFFVQGRGDVIFLSLIFTSLALLRHNRLRLALLCLALAVGSKHTAWFIVPYFAAYLIGTGQLSRKNMSVLLTPALTLVAIFLPFLLWDWHAFYADTFQYPAGTIATSFPILGFGFSQMLLTTGWLPSQKDPYIFIWVAIAALPVLTLHFFLYVKKHPSLSRMLIAMVATLWPFWFFSRFFNDNYLGVVIILVAVAVLLDYDEKGEKKAPAVLVA